MIVSLVMACPAKSPFPAIRDLPIHTCTFMPLALLLCTQSRYALWSSEGGENVPELSLRQRLHHGSRAWHHARSPHPAAGHEARAARLAPQTPSLVFYHSEFDG